MDDQVRILFNGNHHTNLYGQNMEQDKKLQEQDKKIDQLRGDNKYLKDQLQQILKRLS